MECSKILSSLYLFCISPSTASSGTPSHQKMVGAFLTPSNGSHLHNTLIHIGPLDPDMGVHQGWKSKTFMSNVFNEKHGSYQTFLEPHSFRC